MVAAEDRRREGAGFLGGRLVRGEDVREVGRRLDEVEEVYAAGYEPVHAYGEALWLKRNWGSLHTHRGALGEIERERRASST